MVILRLIKVLGGRIERLQDGKDRGKGVQGGRKIAQRRERVACHVFPTPHGWKSTKQVNVGNSSSKEKHVEVTDSERISLQKR